MSTNENGLYRAGWTVSDNYKQITQGEVVGIAFGWIIGVIIFYILGVVIIVKCIPVRKEESEASEKQNGSKEKQGKNSAPKDSKVQQEGGKRRRKIQQSIPTSLELAQSEKPSDFIKSFNIMTNNAATGREQ